MACNLSLSHKKHRRHPKCIPIAMPTNATNRKNAFVIETTSMHVLFEVHCHHTNFIGNHSSLIATGSKKSTSGNMISSTKTVLLHLFDAPFLLFQGRTQTKSASTSHTNDANIFGNCNATPVNCSFALIVLICMAFRAHKRKKAKNIMLACKYFLISSVSKTSYLGK